MLCYGCFTYLFFFFLAGGGLICPLVMSMMLFSTVEGGWRTMELTLRVVP